MEEKQKPQTAEKETPSPQIFVEDLDDIDVDSMLPSMHVSTTPEAEETEEKECIVGDGELLGLYGEILNNTRSDRESVDDVLADFLNMVINDGDSSAASKEAVVALIKLKADISDKMTKVADLMTRIKLKEKDTYPRYLQNQQNNQVVIETGKRDFLKSIDKMAKQKRKKNDPKLDK